MDCSNCGAPLPAKSNVCTYCQTLNETDLRTARQGATAVGASERDCPRCEDRRLTALCIPGFDNVEIDRCKSCHGIFFDPGELEGVMNASVRPISEVDRNELERLIAEERGFEKKVVYLRCPVCKQLMGRGIHGRKSGVIVDRCPQHGIWLDGGELGALLKWAAAGGREHSTAVKQREKQDELERARLRATFPDRLSRSTGWSASNDPDGSGGAGIIEVIGLLGDLFD